MRQCQLIMWWWVSCIVKITFAFNPINSSHFMLDSIHSTVDFSLVFWTYFCLLVTPSKLLFAFVINHNLKGLILTGANFLFPFPLSASFTWEIWLTAKCTATAFNPRKDIPVSYISYLCNGSYLVARNKQMHATGELTLPWYCDWHARRHLNFWCNK